MLVVITKLYYYVFLQLAGCLTMQKISFIHYLNDSCLYRKKIVQSYCFCETKQYTRHTVGIQE